MEKGSLCQFTLLTLSVTFTNEIFMLYQGQKSETALKIWDSKSNLYLKIKRNFQNVK